MNAVRAFVLSAAMSAPLMAQGPAAVREYQPGVDAQHYVLEVRIPDSGGTIGVTGTMHFRRTRAVDTLVLDLEPPMRVGRVMVNGSDVRAVRGERVVKIPLAPWNASCVDANARNEVCQEQVIVDARGEPRDGLIITRDSVLGWKYFGDNWPNRARHWLPVIDHPSDKATVEWRVNAPSRLQVVANGVQVEQSPLPREAGRSISVWRISNPIPTYLMVIGVAPMARVALFSEAGKCGRTEAGSCVVQDVYEMPSLAPRTPPGFAAAARIVEWLAREVGPFPYERLSHVQSSTRFGGMENATVIFYSDNAFRSMTLGEGLVAHETAHQWFGNSATPARWGDLWLSEGFATYFAALWEREARGDTACRRALAGIKRTVLGAGPVASRPVVDTLETDLMSLLNANSYQKGGFVLHMLRREIGDSAWWRGVRAYYAQHKHGNATTDDLRRAMESASGTQLGWFFDQWLRRPGFAELDVSWSYRTRLEVRVTQRGRFGSYRLSLPVEIEQADGRVVRTVVRVPAQPEATVVVGGVRAGRPRRVTFDPDGDLLAAISVRP